MPGAMRNRGAEAARGKYLAFLDSDDLWLPRKLELQTELMRKNTSCRISHTRELWVRNGKTVSQASQKHRRSGRLFKDSLVKCIIGPSTVMIERDLFQKNGGFREDLEIGEDYELWLRVTSKNDVAYLDRPLTVKRAGHADQLTSKYGYIEHFRIEALAALLAANYFHGENRKLAAAELSRKCTIYVAGAEKRGKFKEAEKYASLAMLHSKEKPN
jgi:glycosyltransferase involved in cell wall biosynthesis